MCDEADGGLLVWHVSPPFIYVDECRDGSRKYRDGSAGNGSAVWSARRGGAALSLGDAAAHIFRRRDDGDSPFFSARRSVGTLRSRAGHRTPLDGLSLYRRLSTGVP